MIAKEKRGVLYRRIVETNEYNEELERYLPEKKEILITVSTKRGSKVVEGAIYNTFSTTGLTLDRRPNARDVVLVEGRYYLIDYIIETTRQRYLELIEQEEIPLVSNKDKKTPAMTRANKSAKDVQTDKNKVPAPDPLDRDTAGHDYDPLYIDYT